MKQRFTFKVLLIGTIGLPAALGGEEIKRDHDITSDDYFSLAIITGCTMSPDGKYVAYTEMRWEPPAEHRNTDLWVVEAAATAADRPKPRRLTFDPTADGSPQWGPDGRSIYFTSSPKRAGETLPPWDGKTQVWRVSVDGGEPTPVTRVREGVGAFELSRDGQTLYYTVGAEHVADDWHDLKSKYKDLTYGHGVHQFTQVWKLDLQSWRAEKLVDEQRAIGQMAVAPDASKIAMLTTPTEHLISNEGQSRLDIFDVKTKKIAALPDRLWRADAPSPYGWLDGLAWRADSQALAFAVFFDGYPSEILVAEWKGDDVMPRKLKRPDGVYVTGGLKWRGEAADLCLLADERACSRVFCVRNVSGGKSGEWESLTPGDVVVSAFSFGRSGDEPAVVIGDPSNTYDVAILLDPQFADSATHNLLTNVNPQINAWKLPQIETITWKADDGAEVSGILELPPDHKRSDGPLPMIVEIHGGPTACTYSAMSFLIYGRTLMPAKGYALLSPNYRGSTGYGDKFLTDLIGHENDIEVRDILKGVDALVERGIADPQRLGVMGWSNGGFLTNCLITKDQRFKAASSGAGVVDQVIQWGIEDTPGHVINYMQGFPWSRTQAYLKASPTFALDKIRTPTLIHVGANHARVPPAHSRTLYRALKEYLKVPTELVVYPGEGHGLTKYKSRQAKMEWDLAWFDRYLRDKPTEEPAKPRAD